MITLDRALGWVAEGSRMGQGDQGCQSARDPPSEAWMGPETCSASVSWSRSPMCLFQQGKSPNGLR